MTHLFYVLTIAENGYDAPALINPRYVADVVWNSETTVTVTMRDGRRHVVQMNVHEFKDAMEGK